MIRFIHITIEKARDTLLFFIKLKCLKFACYCCLVIAWIENLFEAVNTEYVHPYILCEMKNY